MTGVLLISVELVAGSSVMFAGQPPTSRLRSKHEGKSLSVQVFCEENWSRGYLSSITPSTSWFRQALIAINDTSALYMNE